MFDCMDFARWILSHPGEEILSDFATKEEYNIYNAKNEDWRKSPECDVIANFLSRGGEEWLVLGTGAYWRANEFEKRNWLPDYLRQTFCGHLNEPWNANHCLIALAYASDEVGQLCNWQCFANNWDALPHSKFICGIERNAKIPQHFFDILVNQPKIKTRSREIWEAHL